MDAGQPSKRLKLDADTVDSTSIRARRATFLNSLSRAVSPPPDRSAIKGKATQSTRKTTVQTSECVDTPLPGSALLGFVRGAGHGVQDTITARATSTASKNAQPKQTPLKESEVLPSPIQLTKIRDLPPSDNIGTVSLHDILGDPLIKEAWAFNFCFDVDWLMQFFDSDVRDLVQVKIVHGSWRREDINKIGIDDACGRWPNVKAIQAYLPDAFGTHHSKMFVLFRHDDCAQIIIHTANILSKDWTNMTQAVWTSPLLPLVAKQDKDQEPDTNIGNDFKHDFIRYLKAYGNKTKLLVQQIQLYNFEAVKAALVASVPSKFNVSASDDEVWGHEMLRRKLALIPPNERQGTHVPHHVFQVSSIASLATNWLEETLYQACKSTKSLISIIFPTAPDVAMSLDGYSAGGSIHTKAQKPIHLKQISTLKPQLCRWTAGSVPISHAGRDLAAPHIKTYIRFAQEPTRSDPTPEIDWALVTSANLSMQAWGSAPKVGKGVKDRGDAVIHIQSYEIGVLFWPELYADIDDSKATMDGKTVIRMIPTFKSDKPHVQPSKATRKIIGFRMPYDLPLTRYSEGDLPWSPQSTYEAPDRHGALWK